MSKPWWRNKNGDYLSIGLIQFDLAGHSGWSSALEDKDLRTEIYKARRQLNLDLKNSVSGYDYHQHHWAGDGGLFVGQIRSISDGDQAYKAMAAMYDAFVRWKSNTRTAKDLHCRISGTYIPDVCIDADPGNWYSAELNSFLKHERSIGRQYAICITQELRRHLQEFGVKFPDQNLFRVHLPDDRTISVYFDISHPITVTRSRLSFRQWLYNQRSELTAAPPSVSHTGLPEGVVQIGDAAIISASVSDIGYQVPPYLEQAQSERFMGDFMAEDDRTRWDGLRLELERKQIKGEKLRVVKIASELLDDPTVRLTWGLGRYVEANAFHSLVFSDPAVAQRYLSEALKVTQAGTRIPSTLSNHAVVILGHGRNRSMLLCHRRKGNRPGTYSSNRWSVSFEEQFNPQTETIGSYELLKDTSIEGSLKRGLREELVGENFTGTVHLAVHAFQLETSILNFGFLGVVHLPNTTFKELLNLWPSARDHEEHDVLAALPLRNDLIRACLDSSELPTSLWGHLETSTRFPSLEPGDHKWHPTSPMRLALALWLAETSE